MSAEPAANGDAVTQDTSGEPQRKKQKRNKPTLSCVECVERKTKTRSTKLRRPSAGKNVNINVNQVRQESAVASSLSPGLPSPSLSFKRSGSSSSSHSSPFLLSNLANTRQVSASVFGSSPQHPFANYWTTKGGLPEVVDVLPSREQADSLVGRYFESVDPVYPMVNRTTFMSDYERFWGLSVQERGRSDPSVLALVFAVFAMGAQFVQQESEVTRAQVAEFYVSAAHQCLRLYTFLSKTSLRTIQAMVLMTYFLMNDNKATDAWAFGGILVRQAYAMGLNRDPNLIIPNASQAEKNQRRKVWQATYFQDTFLTVLLKLPPTTTFGDCTVDGLTEETHHQDAPSYHSSWTTHQHQQQNYPPPQPSMPINTNPMSISNIAPRHASPPRSYPPPLTGHSDIDYFRCMWRMADLVQASICSPRALSRPVATSTHLKRELVGKFHNLHASFPKSLTTRDRTEFVGLLGTRGGRMARQNLFLRSNFWHCVMLIEADESLSGDGGGVRCNVRGAVEAGRVAVGAFFDFWDCIRGEAGVWWVMMHRGFEEALTMANLLAAYGPSLSGSGPTSPLAIGGQNADPLFIDALRDIRRMLDIVEHVGSAAPEMQKTRTEVLRKAVEGIAW